MQNKHHQLGVGRAPLRPRLGSGRRPRGARVASQAPHQGPTMRVAVACVQYGALRFEPYQLRHVAQHRDGGPCVKPTIINNNTSQGDCCSGCADGTWPMQTTTTTTTDGSASAPTRIGRGARRHGCDSAFRESAAHKLEKIISEIVPMQRQQQQQQDAPSRRQLLQQHQQQGFGAATATTTTPGRAMPSMHAQVQPNNTYRTRARCATGPRLWRPRRSPSGTGRDCATLAPRHRDQGKQQAISHQQEEQRRQMAASSGRKEVARLICAGGQMNQLRNNNHHQSLIATNNLDNSQQQHQTSQRKCNSFCRFEKNLHKLMVPTTTTATTMANEIPTTAATTTASANTEISAKGSPRRLSSGSGPNDDEMDLIKKASRPNPWHWSEVDKSPECVVSEDKLSVCIHPVCSESSAACLGSKPFKRNCNLYYWELDVLDKTYGTSVMFGLCTKGQNLHISQYCNLIGKDEKGWSLSHKGLIWHNGTYRQYTQMFPANQPVKIGLLYNTFRGELSYFMDGKNLGVAFCGLNDIQEDLYPVVGSTAKCTRIYISGSYCSDVTLLERCCFTITRNSRYLDELKEYLHRYRLPNRLIDYISQNTEACGSRTAIKTTKGVANSLLIENNNNIFVDENYQQQQQPQQTY